MLVTKLRISEALLDLLKNDELIDIQMKEIADKAEVSSRTIRRYFNGKTSILLFYLKYLNSSIDFSSVDTTLKAVNKYISFWKQENELVQLLKQRGLVYLITQANMEYSNEALNENIPEYHIGNETLNRYLINVIIHIEVALFHSWIENDYDLDLDKSLVKVKETYHSFKEMELK